MKTLIFAIVGTYVLYLVIRDLLQADERNTK
jgi:hypothetical protein